MPGGRGAADPARGAGAGAPGASRAGRWPALPLSEWTPTRDTVQLWTQVLGKVRLANTPVVNHWWNVPLYVDARGLTTSLVHHPTGVRVPRRGHGGARPAPRPHIDLAGPRRD